MTTNRYEWGSILLRFSLAAVYLWFGFSQLMDGVNWVGFVPEWAVALIHLPPAMIVLANGLFEVIAASFLIFGIFVRSISVVLALHLGLIAFGVGYSAIAVRDAGLAFATLALSLLHTARREEITPIA